MNPGHTGGRKRRGRDVSGILLLDKPRGISSNEALQRAKRIFQASKAGHTGNLDVQASGLLPVCFGEATKLCQFLLEADKRYITEVTLGRRTTTGDSEGETVAVRSAAAITRAGVEQVMQGFLGAIEQLPPMHSAIKRNGQPLYKLAHQGIEVERDKRTVRIHAFTLLEFDNPRAVVDVTCSKGTYIRTLAEDVGEKLGCGAFVSLLRRERAGPYELAEAWSLERLQWLAQGGEEMVDRALLPLDSALSHMPAVHLDEDAAYYLLRGQAVQVARAPTAGLLRLYDGRERLLGVGEVLADGRIAPRRLLRLQASESKGDSIRTRA